MNLAEPSSDVEQEIVTLVPVLERICRSAIPEEAEPAP
jgi:hypothetical protein